MTRRLKTSEVSSSELHSFIRDPADDRQTFFAGLYRDYRTLKRAKEQSGSHDPQSQLLPGSAEPPAPPKVWRTSGLDDVSVLFLHPCRALLFDAGLRLLGVTPEPQSNARSSPQTDSAGQRRSPGFFSVLWPEAEEQPGCSEEGGVTSRELHSAFCDVCA